MWKTQLESFHILLHYKDTLEAKNLLNPILFLSSKKKKKEIQFIHKFSN